jgi:hypothetical protein
VPVDGGTGPGAPPDLFAKAEPAQTMTPSETQRSIAPSLWSFLVATLISLGVYSLFLFRPGLGLMGDIYREMGMFYGANRAMRVFHEFPSWVYLYGPCFSYDLFRNPTSPIFFPLSFLNFFMKAESYYKLVFFFNILICHLGFLCIARHNKLRPWSWVLPSLILTSCGYWIVMSAQGWHSMITVLWFPLLCCFLTLIADPAHWSLRSIIGASCVVACVFTLGGHYALIWAQWLTLAFMLEGFLRCGVDPIRWVRNVLKFTLVPLLTVGLTAVKFFPVYSGFGDRDLPSPMGRVSLMSLYRFMTRGEKFWNTSFYWEPLKEVGHSLRNFHLIGVIPPQLEFDCYIYTGHIGLLLLIAAILAVPLIYARKNRENQRQMGMFLILMLVFLYLGVDVLPNPWPWIHWLPGAKAMISPLRGIVIAVTFASLLLMFALDEIPSLPARGRFFAGFILVLSTLGFFWQIGKFHVAFQKMYATEADFETHFSSILGPPLPLKSARVVYSLSSEEDLAAQMTSEKSADIIHVTDWTSKTVSFDIERHKSSAGGTAFLVVPAMRYYWSGWYLMEGARKTYAIGSDDFFNGKGFFIIHLTPGQTSTHLKLCWKHVNKFIAICSLISLAAVAGCILLLLLLWIFDSNNQSSLALRTLAVSIIQKIFFVPL